MSNFLNVVLSCNGRELRFGKRADETVEEFKISKITGLESSTVTVTQTKNAMMDGATTDSIRIEPRVIHIEATLQNDTSLEYDRQRIIQFFNPKHAGKLYVNHSGTERNIEYELEGWTFDTRENVFGRLAITADLICADPYFQNVSNFGKNMANVVPLTAFPWRVLSKKVTGIADPYKPFGLKGWATGYRSMTDEAVLVNDGHVDCGIIIKCIASRGDVVNPKILHKESGKYIRVKLTLRRGDELEIDTTKKHQAITLNGKNYYQRIDRTSQNFQIDVGDNTLIYSADSGYVNMDVYLYYTPLYLGV